MSDVTIDDSAAGAIASAQDEVADERLVYQGVFQRLFIRPEVGATLAAASIWIFFWAVSGPFGLTGGASTILDVSSTLGIMAVAVSMLMIGGEFDLSAGAATGALGIVTLLLVRDITGDMGGAGLSLWVALPLSFIVAMGLGWFNGTMVNRTSLPSFIVTLGSFFIIVGAKLGFAKLLVDQIQVGKLDDLAIAADDRGGDKGYAFFDRIFGAEWDRNSHIWEARDAFYTIAIVAGLVLLFVGLHELYFRRRKERGLVSLAGVLPGVAVLIAGILILHNTDDTGGNALGAAVIGAAMLVGSVGLCAMRYSRHPGIGSLGSSAPMLKALGAGVVAVALAVVAALSFDPAVDEDITFLVTEQGLRAILFVGLSMIGAVLLLVGQSRARSISRLTGSVVLALIGIGVAAMAFFIRAESASPKFRGQVFSIMLAVAAAIVVWSIATTLFEERRFIDARADRFGQSVAIAGILAMVVGVTIRMLWVTQVELDRGIPPAKFSVRIIWFFVFTAACTWVLARTKFGSWVFAVGGNKDAARQIGVPAARTKTQLFMLVSGAAWLVGVLLAFRLNTIQANTGDGEEFEYIIAAVVGGTMLTGGYGSTFGAAIGAVIMAMAIQGLPSSRWNSDWRFVFLGAILLLSVIANNYIRSKAEAIR